MTTPPRQSSDSAASDPASTIHRSWASRLADWGKYAAAAGAALATGASAEAGIVYVHPASPEDVKVPGTAPFNGSVAKQFPVDGIGLEIRVRELSTFYGAQHFAGLNATGTKHLRWDTTSGFGIGFGQGQPIAVGPSGANTSGPLLRDHIRGYPAPVGYFVSGKTNFAGFQLPASKGGGLGWMRFEVIDRDNDTYPDELQAIDWAYNDAGGGINAGQVPEPSSAALALLAAGSAGVLAWRRLRPSGQ